MASGAESRSLLKGPLGASSAEEWNVQKLSNSGNPFQDGGSSDVKYSSAHLFMILVKTRTTKLKLQPNKNVLFRDMTCLLIIKLVIVY